MDSKMLCNILEVKYLKMFGREIILGVNNNDDLYPNDWFLDSNYDLKVQILTEALNNHQMIIDTELYQANIEGVRKSR